MTLEIEIWTTDRAVKQGDGPITTAVSIRASERLNEAAQWSFRMPAEDANAADVVMGREAYGYAWVGDNRLCVFGGEILQVDTRENGQGGLDLDVKGLGKLNDLNYEYIDEYRIRAKQTGIRPLSVVELRTGLASLSKPNLYDGDTGTSSTVNLERGAGGSEKWLAVFYPEEIFSVTVDINTANTSESTLEAQYHQTGGSWNTASGLSDGTSGGAPAATMNSDGTISWTAITDREDVISDGRQGAWIRFYPASGSVTDPITANINEITLEAYAETSTDISDLMTAHGGGMSIDSTYYSATANGSYHIIQRATCLQALRQVAEIEGGMFRIKAHDDMELSYLRATAVTTNYYAVGPASPADGNGLPTNQILITGLQRFTDTRKQVTRLYVYGAGNGDNRVTLERANDTLPTNYSYDTAGSHITWDDGGATGYASNTKAGVKVFPNIKGDGTEVTHGVANMLLAAGLAELKDRRLEVEELRMELAHLPAVLRVGDSINVHYYREREGDTAALSIDGAYTITQINHSIENGVLLAFATCSNVKRPPLTENEEFLRLLEQNSRALATPQPVASTAVKGARVYEAN